MLAALLGAYHGLSMWLGFPVFVPVLTAIISVAVFTGNYFQSETVRKRAELKLSHEEVRRLAALAERERIGRDLHDLLGHTLSLVALKSDLAGRLIGRDPQAARNEINEVSRVARDALAQVRRAVTGIRAAGLAAELASARLLLESDGVTLRYDAQEVALPADLGIEGAGELHSTLTRHVDDATPVVLDGGEVSRIHTAALQLFCLFCRDRRDHGHETRWQAASPALRSAAALLGIATLLQLAQEPAR